jgi:serine/threonine-protein kinase
MVTTDLMTRLRDPRSLAKELLQRGWLTVYQINQIFQADGRDLVLGPYGLLDVVGEGAVARVFRAWDSRERRQVALKVIRQELMAHPEAIRQFEQETETIASLNHPNIVQTLKAAKIGDAHFVVMEFLEGIDLGKLLRLSGPLPIRNACDCVRQAALALQHAHECCRVHRDIKPAHLFLVMPNEPGTPSEAPPELPVGAVVKVLDWGLADMRPPVMAVRHEEVAAPAPEEPIGTADYLAPEQATEASKADIRADIYSLGCTFYHLLTGNPPFPGGSLLQKILKHREAPPPPLAEQRPTVPPGVVAVVQKMLAKKPEERYRTPGLIAVALKHFAR